MADDKIFSVYDKIYLADDKPSENTLALIVVPRVTNIHLSPAALMNEVTRHNKGFLWVHTAPVLSLSEQIQQNNKLPFIAGDHSDTYNFTSKPEKRGGEVSLAVKKLFQAHRKLETVFYLCSMYLMAR